MVGGALADWVDRDAMCRVCLCPNPVAKWNLFECTIVGRSVAEILTEVTGVPVRQGDKYPTVCCSGCMKQVEVAHRLREQCRESERRLVEIFEKLEGMVVDKAVEKEGGVSDIKEEPEYEMILEEESLAGSAEVEAPLQIAAIHGLMLPEEAVSVAAENPPSTVISNFQVDGLEIRIEVPGLENILLQNAVPEEPSTPQIIPSEASAPPLGGSPASPIGESSAPPSEPSTPPTSASAAPPTSTSSAPPIAIECCGCPLTFPTEEKFEAHVQEVHEPHRPSLHLRRKTPPYECFRCYKLVHILKSHHMRGNFCKICSQYVVDSRHYRDKHGFYLNPKPEGKFECCGCPHIFFKEQEFKDHVETVHKPQRTANLKPGQTECFRCYKPVARLKDHHMRHQFCKICSRQFPDSKSAKLHYKHKHRTYSDSTHEMKICCGCAAPFKKIGDLKIHSNQVHYQHLPKFDKERPFQCEICFQNYRDYDELHEHQTRYQKNNKPHQCEDCGRSFFFLNSLRDHQKTHKRNQRAPDERYPPHRTIPSNTRWPPTITSYTG